MGRTRDEEFWNYVERVDRGLKCKFCGNVFKGNPSISRIKSHLSGEPRQGIQVCEKVPHHVKERACEANKRRKTMPSSSSNPSSRRQSDQVEIEPTPSEVQGLGHEAVPEMATSFPYADFETRTATNAGETGHDQAEIENGLPERATAETMQLVEPRGEELLTKELLGEKFIKRIQNLQDAIASVVDLDLSRVIDEHRKAAKLSKALGNDKKFILFLDNVWDYIPMNKVGIPVDMNGCKWILTTRSLDVCLKMDCQWKIKLNPLSPEESWLLFLKELGNKTKLSKEIEEIAKSIATKCEGLPLGIEVMARNMKGEDGIHRWRDALNELEEVITRKANLELFGKLKRSYDNLDTSTLQQCFLYCEFLSYRVKISRLVEHLIDEEIIQGKRRQAAFDKGHSMLDRLEKVGLLEIDVESKCVNMHGLIRAMAIQIIKSNGGVMLKACAKLEEIPDCQEWTEDLVKVSLGCNRIKKIPPDFSPRCPKLSTLLLLHNSLRNIPYSFFERLNGLKVLDLSYTDIEELPSSISDLENLNVLVLSHCRKLQHLPSVSKLKALKKLDLEYCKILEKLPQGIEFTSNLRYLDICYTEIKEFPVGILPKLLNLQVLKLLDYLEGEEFAFLRKLETLTCCFQNVGELITLPSNLNCYTLMVGELDLWDDDDDDDDDGDVLEPHDRNLFIDNCSETEHFLFLSLSCPSLFQSLQSIKLRQLEEENTAAALPSSLPHSTFSQLKEFYMTRCSPSVKKLFPPRLVSNFQNLETLTVEACEEMEEIIATEEEHESHDSIQFVLPKLKWFSLENLPNLKSICRGDIISNSLEIIEIVDCEKLNRVAVSFMDDSEFYFLPSLESIRVGPEEWWERVELVHPEAKNFLSTPSACFIDGVLTFYPNGNFQRTE